MSDSKYLGVKCPIDMIDLYETYIPHESCIIICDDCGADYSLISPADDPERLREMAKQYTKRLEISIRETRSELNDLERLVKSARENGLLED